MPGEAASAASFNAHHHSTFFPRKNFSCVWYAIAELETELDIDDKNGTLRNCFVTSFQKYTEVEEITSEIVADVLNTVFVYPGGRLEIIWNYREEYEKLLLSLCGDEQ